MSASSDLGKFEKTFPGMADGNAEEDDNFGLDWDAIKKEATQTGNDTGQPEGNYERKEEEHKPDRRSKKTEKKPKNKGSTQKNGKAKVPKEKHKKSNMHSGTNKNIVPLLFLILFIALTIGLVYGMLKGSGNTMVGGSPNVYSEPSPAPADPSDQGPDPVLPQSSDSQIDGANPAPAGTDEPVAAQAGLQAAPLAGEE